MLLKWLFGTKCCNCGTRSHDTADSAVSDPNGKVCDKCARDAFAQGDRKLGALSVVSLSLRGSVPFSLLDGLPLLVDLANDEDRRVAESAADLATKLRLKIPVGRDACPRCGSSSATEGSSTGWRCNGCGLTYKSRGGRKPLSFADFGGGPPWRPSEIVDLLCQIEQARSQPNKDEKLWIEIRRRAEKLSSIRREFVQ